MKFIIHPDDSKKVVFQKSKEVVEAFCEHNNIVPPKIVDKKIGSFGCYYYDSDDIIINIKKCKPQTKTPGWAWSYSGSRADLTVAGVLAHETGHYIDNYLARSLNTRYRMMTTQPKISKIVRELKRVESPTTGYEPDNQEVLAEAMRIFILNPDLLKHGRPWRYRFFVDVLKLHPIVSIPWEEVLSEAHPRIRQSLSSWIIKEQKRRDKAVSSSENKLKEFISF